MCLVSDLFLPESELFVWYSRVTGVLVLGVQADIDRFGDDGSLDDNVESFLSHEEADPREPLFGTNKRSPAGHSMDVSQG